MPNTLLYLGPPGSHSHAAALDLVTDWPLASVDPGSVQLSPITTISEAFTRLSAHERDDSLPVHSEASFPRISALVPIENSTYGAVVETLDGLSRGSSSALRVQIAKEQRICHSLMSLESDLSQIKTVYSHPQVRICVCAYR